jgi:hypothetical protein
MKSSQPTERKHVIAMIFLMLDLAGCATTGQCPPSDQFASIMVADSSLSASNAKVPHSSIVSIKSKAFPSCKAGNFGEGVGRPGPYGPPHGPFKLAPGPNVVVIDTIWSNWFRDKTELVVEAEAKNRYRAAAIELKPDQDPASVWIRQKTAGEEMVQAMKEGTVGSTAVLWLPWALLKGKIAGARPTADCCFVWIEELNSGKTVVGKKPTDQ